MNQIFIFDIDGTLTPARQAMTDEMIEVFRKFCQTERVVLATGSDMEKVKEQVPEDILALVENIFTCSGNVLYTGGEEWGELVYKRDFEPAPDLLEFLGRCIEFSSCPVKTGRHLEHRPGMLNFSTIGRNCTQAQREEYYHWDSETGERKAIQEKLGHMYPALDCAIGGQISVDIYPRGMDKSQAYNYLKSREPKTPIVFLGDRLRPGGNDYPFFRAMSKSHSSCRPLDICVPVHDWLDTKRFIRNVMEAKK